MKSKFFVPFVLACALMCSCSSSSIIEPLPIDETLSVELDSTAINLEIGGSATINAVVSDAEVAVKWVNSDANVIAVVPSGKKATITAKASGTAYVTAIAGGQSQYCTVTVGSGGEAIVVNEISLDKTSATIDLKETLLLTATVTHEGSQAIQWVSSNEDVATVAKQDTRTALVSPKAVGETVITAVSGNKTATCTVTVENFDSDNLAIKLDKTSLTLEVEKEAQLTATVKPTDAVITWQSSDHGVATVNASGKVTAVKVGTAVISASVTKDEVTKTATCNISVTGKQETGEYDKFLETWSKPGHLYMHYLRTSDQSYKQWALWIWQNYPKDGEGSLWGANTTDYTLAVSAQTNGYMTNAQVGLAGNDMYVDEHGAIIDVDLTLLDIKGGKSGVLSPLIYEDQWDDAAVFNKLALGFLIVDQSKMTGKDMWTSDGGAETYIKKLGTRMKEGKDSSLHVYCIEGNVANFTTASSEKQEATNPTLTDDTGKYRSVNDITDLKKDAYSSGVSTSETFLNDRPGVGYQIFVPSFADSDGDGYGDIQGIISKLDYLNDLGVEVLWLTPIQESNSYHGYDVTDYYKIDQRFGTLQDYQELLFKAHAKGMKVLMDMVINHTSKSNVLFQKSQKAVEETINGKTIKYRDMYLWKFKDDPILEWNGVEGKYDKDNPATYITKKVQESDDWYKDGTSNYYYFGKFGSGMAELNYSSQATRDYMTDMCKYWLSFGLDGFRLDAIKHIYLLSELDPTDFSSKYVKSDYITYDVSYRTYYNEETTKEETVQNDYSYDRDLNVMFWKQFAGTLKAAYPNCFLVGENFDGWNERMAPFYEAIDSQFDFSMYYHLNEKPFEGMPYDIGNSLKIYQTAASKRKGQAINGAYTSNHDIARLLNHAAGYAGDYVASGNHHVEISSQNAAGARNNARVYAAFTLLTPGVSWIYYGDELGMSGNTADRVADSNGNYVNDHGNNVDRWYRQPMRWGTKYGEDMVVNYKFSGLEVLWDNYNASLPTASAQQADATSMYNLFKAAAKAKNDDKYPTYGQMGNYWYEVDGSMVCMQLTDGTRTVNVFINYSGSTQTISALNRGAWIGGSNGSNADSFTVGAYGFAVVAK